MPAVNAFSRAQSLRLPSPYRVPWAELLQRMFAVDVLECPGCSGRLHVLSFFTEAATSERILAPLGEATEAPPLARAQTPPVSFDPDPDYGAPDPAPAD